MKVLNLELQGGSYPITVGAGLLEKIETLININRRTVIVTDEGVPTEYADAVLKKAKEGTVITLPMGEGTKSFKYFEYLLERMLDFGLTRTDCIVAVGGGVVGDLTGFAAASYMRGIDFYNLPTTLLSAVDSSVGGKVAINLLNTKNTVGAFYQPKAVVIDTDCLKTLDKRQIAAGLAESLKMSMTSDKELFSIFENELITEDKYEDIIIRSLRIKTGVVEEDEKESGVRKILNFGHTLGHGIEAECLGKLYHGECVALGMIPMTDKDLRPRLLRILEKLGLPTRMPCELDAALSHVKNDKKASGDSVSAIFVDEIGKYRITKLEVAELSEYVKSNI